MIWRLFLSPFIFATRKTDSRLRKMIVRTTRNERNHITFDSLSLLENCLLSFFGGQNIANVEPTFNTWLFFGTITGIHLLGLFLKCCYYRYQHPWMSLSMVYKDLSKFVQTILVLLGLSIIVMMNLSVELFSLNSTYTSIIYTIFGFIVLLVSTVSFF
mgnify:FL=1